MNKVALNIAPGHGTRACFIGLLIIPNAGESGEAPAALATLVCKHSNEGKGRGFLEKNTSLPCFAFPSQPLLAPAARASWGQAQVLSFGPGHQGKRLCGYASLPSPSTQEQVGVLGVGMGET